jgi:ATP-dependent Lhr-like helicase
MRCVNRRSRPHAARRDLLARFMSLGGAVSIDDVLERYDFERGWIEERLDEWTRTGKLVRGTFGRGATITRWCSRRLLEQARRRELAQARKQIEAVDLARFSRFVQEWQHIDPRARLADDEGTTRVIRQMYGLARPAEQWERAYLPARIEDYNPDTLTRLIGLGELVWVGGHSAKPDEAGSLSTVRFLRRGMARAWVSSSDEQPLSEHAQRVLEVLQRDGASFLDEIVSSSTLDVAQRSRRAERARRRGARDERHDGSVEPRHRLAARWFHRVTARSLIQRVGFPADFTPSANRYVVQRRPNLRRLPKWKRPDVAGGEDTSNWPGRWSLVRVPRVLGPEVGRERVGGVDRPAVARPIRCRVARDVAA